MVRHASILAGVASIALAAGLASPASADIDRFHDKKNDVNRQIDVRGVRVDNTGRWIDIRTHHRNLTYGKPASNSSVVLYLDTNRKRRGPEFVMAGPVGFDGDYHLSKMKPRWGKVTKTLRCKVTFRVNYKRDVVRFATKRGCLAHAYKRRVNRIRVSVAGWQARHHGKKEVTDWAPGRRQFFDWVKRS